MERSSICSKDKSSIVYNIASISAILSFIILLMVVAYSSNASNQMDILMAEVQQVVADIKVVLPDVKNTMARLKKECNPENITKIYLDQMDTLLSNYFPQQPMQPRGN